MFPVKNELAQDRCLLNLGIIVDYCLINYCFVVWEHLFICFVNDLSVKELKL